MKQTEYIYRVSFEEAPHEGDPRCDFYFYSLSAIYEQFTPEQIGCRVERLWNIGVSSGAEYENRTHTVKITRESVARKHRTPSLID